MALADALAAQNTPLYVIVACSVLLTAIGVVARSRRHTIAPEEIAPRMNALLARGAPARVADALAHGEKIQAIKAYRQVYTVGLREAKEAVDAMESDLARLTQSDTAP